MQDRVKRSFLLSCALMLGACAQQPTSGQAPPSPVASRPSPGVPDARPVLLSPEQAALRVQASNLQWPLAAPAPTWAKALIDAQGCFTAGALHLGVPMLLRSPVRFAPDPRARAADDGRTLGRTDADQARLLGDAALVPLLQRSGEAVGLLRVSLVAPAQGTRPSLDYVLFDQPVANLMTAAEAAVAAGRPNARVMAVALDSQGSYDPFQFHWAVEAASKTSPPTLLAPGVPSLITRNGERIETGSAQGPSLSTQVLQQPITPVQAGQAFARYRSTLNVNGGQR